MAEKVNYTPEMEEQLKELYLQLGNDGLEDIAAKMSKPLRSIRSKLVQMGAYQATPKAPASKVNGPSKKELLRDIDSHGFDTTGFDAATKDALLRLLHFVEEKH